MLIVSVGSGIKRVQKVLECLMWHDAGTDMAYPLPRGQVVLAAVSIAELVPYSQVVCLEQQQHAPLLSLLSDPAGMSARRHQCL